MGSAGFKPGGTYFVLYLLVPALKCRAKHKPTINRRIPDNGYGGYNGHFNGCKRPFSANISFLCK